MQEYLKQVISAAFMIAIVQSLVPKGFSCKVLTMACGLLLMLVLIQPVKKFNIQKFAALFSQQAIGMPNYEQLQAENQENLLRLISEQTRTYILDKAAELSFTPKEVEVQVQMLEQYPYPHAVTISGMYTQSQRVKLTEWIENNLAIPEKNQTWRWVYFVEK